MTKAEFHKYGVFGSALMALREVDGLKEGNFDPEAEHVDPIGSEKAKATIDFMFQSGEVVVLIKLYKMESPLGEFRRADIITSDPDSDSTETVNIYNDGDAAELKSLAQTQLNLARTVSY